MRNFIRAMTVLVLTAAPGSAEEKAQTFDFGGDSFRAGATVVLDAAGTDDLFMAGETVRGEADISGSAHLAGRRVTMTGAVGGDAYLAGMDVVLEGPVAGDATLAGYDVRVGAVGGDLRLSGAKLAVGGPVAGYALIAGDDVRIGAAIKGDVNLTARTVEFADGARIDGKLTLFEEAPGTLTIPTSVASEDRIERRDLAEWEAAARPLTGWSWTRAVGRFLTGVIIVAALAALVAAVMPRTLAAMRRSILERPLRNLWIGFLAQSAVIGSAVLFAMTLIGALLVPAVVLVALAGGFVGYILAVYAFGVALVQAVGRPEPQSVGERAICGGVGALAAGIIALVPILGWLFVLALTLTGLGAVVQRLFRPRFLAPA
ncbi:hypothetical protein OEZ60_03930 [Defluviimonas sp. WL0024]|uniref:DUF8173 domain-containing protein n=2 Tax=Albidovulum TaxID=205889 RepID=A0ABT3IZS0_9RHOB|nr:MULTISPECIES: hypothetical protein [Defluviimonas]MCU9847147.1 hypothetical protein [Defluviimonas sp. WL0024]MCW3780947.1 hypothetical protein [Defluviimonas salinarum]